MEKTEYIDAQLINYFRQGSLYRRSFKTLLIRQLGLMLT